MHRLVQICGAGRRVIVLAIVPAVTMAALMLSGCKRDPPESSPTTAADAAGNAALEPAHADVVVFPESLHVEDASVNLFIENAMHVCTSGDYEAYRLLWSAREKPLARAEYELGWSSVREVRILAVEGVALVSDQKRDAGAPETTYGVAAHVRLDPERLPVNTKLDRDVVLMLTREHQQWRLASAPKPLRTWLKKKAGLASADAQNPTVQPESRSP